VLWFERPVTILGVFRMLLQQKKRKGRMKKSVDSEDDSLLVKPSRQARYLPPVLSSQSRQSSVVKDLC
jgi:hypothetical protein